MRSEDDRLARDDWFDGILAAVGRQALADENDGRRSVPVTKLARRIEEQTINFVTVAFEIASTGDSQPERFQCCGNFIRALCVTRRHD